MILHYDGVVRVMKMPDGRWQAGYAVSAPGDDRHVRCDFGMTTVARTRSGALKALFKDWEDNAPVYEVSA
jgi:hypothetical protein